MTLALWLIYLNFFFLDGWINSCFFTGRRFCPLPITPRTTAQKWLGLLVPLLLCSSPGARARCGLFTHYCSVSIQQLPDWLTGLLLVLTKVFFHCWMCFFLSSFRGSNMATALSHQYRQRKKNSNCVLVIVSHSKPPAIIHFILKKGAKHLFNTTAGK